MKKQSRKAEEKAFETDKQTHNNSDNSSDSVTEIGGFDGPEPTRYGDWEKNGRCVDF